MIGTPSGRYIKVNRVIVRSCDQPCPRNMEHPNPIWSILPPSHNCIDTFDPQNANGRPIFFRNIIPDWCPYEVYEGPP